MFVQGFGGGVGEIVRHIGPSVDHLSGAHHGANRALDAAVQAHGDETPLLVVCQFGQEVVRKLDEGEVEPLANLGPDYPLGRRRHIPAAMNDDVEILPVRFPAN